MSLYFFHVRDDRTALDSDGLELPDLDSARDQAIRTCGEILRDIPAAIWNGDSLRLWITDQPDGRGNTLFSLNVSSTRAA